MRKVTLSLALLFATLLPALAQVAPGDKIIGDYWVVQDDDKSKVRFTKIGENTYRAQVTWLEHEKDAKGNIRRDIKNPDESKRTTPASQIVLIDKITFKNGEWGEGKIYDPTRGKYFNVCAWFTDNNTLCVKGSWGPFSQKIYWPRYNGQK